MKWTHRSLNLDISLFANRRFTQKIIKKRQIVLDPDEMVRYEPSHLDLHCLRRYQCWSAEMKGLTCLMHFGKYKQKLIQLVWEKGCFQLISEQSRHRSVSPGHSLFVIKFNITRWYCKQLTMLWSDCMYKKHLPQNPLRKHAYSNILKILPSKKKKKKKKKKKWKFSDKNSDILPYFCSKHRLWVHVKTASARRF